MRYIQAFIRSWFVAHKLLWGRLVWERWDALSLENKILCLLVVNNLIAIITVIELLLFKK